MADYKKLIPHIIKWEGGIADDKDDQGGFTNKGITIGTWKMFGYDNDHDGDIDEKDLTKVTMDQWGMIFKYQYWNRAQGDSIKDQKVAEIIVDWLWGSGYYALKNTQRVLNTMGYSLETDGVFGRETMKAINSVDGKELAKRLHERRLKFYDEIVANKPSQKKFLKGWKNRANYLYK